MKHASRRMKHFAALPQNMKHRRCGMKQSLFRLHVFFIAPAILKGFLSLKLQNFAVKSNSENRFTVIQETQNVQPKKQKKIDKIGKNLSFMACKLVVLLYIKQ